MNPDQLYDILSDLFGDRDVRSGQFKINCFRCDDSTKNLEISLEKEVFHCWKCDYSGKIWQLLKDYLGHAPKIEEDYVKASDLRNLQLDFDQKILEEPKFKGLPEEFCPLWTKKTLSMVGQKVKKYALRRIGQEGIEKYRVGYCGLGKYRWRIVIPVFEDGRVVYWVARSIYNTEPIYLYPEVEREAVIFNIDRARELGQAVITEGALDAIRVGDDGVAIFSTVLLDQQLFKLLDIPSIIVMLDEDAREKALKIAQKLSEQHKPSKLVFLPKGDPSDWPRESLRMMISQAEPYKTGTFTLNPEEVRIMRQK
jgi:DNA primase